MPGNRPDHTEVPAAERGDLIRRILGGKCRIHRFTASVNPMCG
jgi:hypothetical protein